MVISPDGTRLHVEDTGSGLPVLFIHEFAGDHRSWEPQVRRWSRQYRCITYAARGYPPSDVPMDPTAYSQDAAVADAVAVLDSLGIDQAHIVGLSMGGFCALHLARSYPRRVTSVVAGGVGYGAAPQDRARFRRECDAIADAFEREGSEAVASRYGHGPARIQFERKDPRGHAEFVAHLGQHSSLGAALTMRGFQRERPSLHDFIDEFADFRTPTLILVGDEDEGAIDASVWLKRTIPTAGLSVLPQAGHTLNLEEPELFNALVSDFFTRVEHGAWHARDLSTSFGSATGFGQD